MTISRRKFIQLLGLASASIVVSSGLNGCQSNDSNNNSSFDYGVASGDPLKDRVIIWTRITPETNDAVKVSWEVAEDESFTNLVNSDETLVTSDTDYTLKVDVQGLEAGKQYFYRFYCNGVYSSTGKTKTLVDETAESVKFAVFSCANFPAGFFHIYDAAASRSNNIDAVLHLGDYIYEYDIDGYPDAGNGEKINRVHQPTNECITLDDYRTRYAQYRSDPSLQNLHASLPFICVWDDHEIANDTYIDGAENHDTSEGNFFDRRAAAIKAWYEWLPVRAPEIEANRIKTYRRFDFGNILSLLMLDTRVIGRDKQLDYFDYYSSDGVFDAASFQADMQDSNRSLLGADQLTWLQGQLQDSVAQGQKWQVLGQQVLMAKMNLPSSIIQLDPSTGKPDPSNLAIYQQTASAYQALITKIVTDLTIQGDLPTYAAGIPNFNSLNTTEQGIALTLAMQSNEPARYGSIFSTLTLEEQTTLQTYGDLLDPNLNPAIPYNLDAWDGYAVEREIIYATAQALSTNLVVLAGDTHNAWAANLTDLNGTKVGVEFATASVSSPGMEKYLSIPEGAESSVESGITQLVEDLVFTNLTQRGYLEITFNQAEVLGEWLFIGRGAEKLSNTPALQSLKTLRSLINQPDLMT